MAARIVAVHATQNTDWEFTDTFDKGPYPTLRRQNGTQAEITLIGRRRFEVTVCGRPWKRGLAPTYGQLRNYEFDLPARSPFV